MILDKERLAEKTNSIQLFGINTTSSTCPPKYVTRNLIELCYGRYWGCTFEPFAVLFFFDSTWAFQPIVDVLRPQSHGVGRALLGMTSPTLRKVPGSKIRFSTGAVRIIAD